MSALFDFFCHAGSSDDVDVFSDAHPLGSFHLFFFGWGGTHWPQGPLPPQ